ncbi:MAG: hypothetical protein AB7Q17_00695 [Phycisphaerae bacterium]
MRHVRDIDLIDLAAGRAVDSTPVGAHLETCAACRRRLEELRVVHDALCSWEATGASADLWPAIQEQLDRPGTSRTLTLPAWAAALLRSAAIVLASVGLGHGLALVWAPGPRVFAAAGEDVDIALAMHVLEGPLATGLSIALDDLEDAGDHGGAR